MERVTLTSRAFYNDQYGPFLARLSEVSGFPKALLMNSGAEAVETGLKAVRKWGYTVKGVAPDQAEIIVATDNFHGRTITIVSFSTEPQYRDGFGPFTPGFRVVPYGDAGAVAAAITPQTVAVFVEPIQGEAGVRVPPEGYLRRLREICDASRTLLFIDEIQTGLGRTGRMWAFEHEGVRPDCISVGKALGGGVYPVSAFCATEEVMGVFQPGDHGSTFGGGPVVCAAGRATIAGLLAGDFGARSLASGADLQAGGARCADRGAAGRQRGGGRRALYGAAARDPQPACAGSPGTRPPDRRGAEGVFRPGPALLRAADGARPALQGHARAGDPLRAAADHRESRHRRRDA